MKNKTQLNKLSNEQEQILNLLEKTNEQMFITGRAGTGKSYLLQQFRRLTKKKVVVVAPTGVAALNVGGQTIHSLFKIAPGFREVDKLNLDERVDAVLKNIDTIVIDEVSMVRADLMDAIDYLCRKSRKNDLPFGGLQIVMFGDPYQLPPVVDDGELLSYFWENYGGYHFFHAHVWREAEMQIYELINVYRQKEKRFKKMLDAVRVGNIDEEVISQLNCRVAPIPETDELITLCSTNRAANMINEAKLRAIAKPAFVYPARVMGQMEPGAMPAEDKLVLKTGARVMLLRNDREQRWANGTLATVDKIDEENIWVKIGKEVHKVEMETWAKIRYVYKRTSGQVEEEVVSSFIQYPLKLAWAVTIHKSQGGTYEASVIDLGRGAFAAGQTYVALSRCTSLEGIYLKRPLSEKDILVDPEVVNFMSRARIWEVE